MQAMLALAEGLQRNKVFLALDNVWDLPVVGLEIAKKILSLAEYGSGSRVLVTSRSKEILKRLGVIKAAHVPSMSEAEAVEALKSYSCFSDSIPPEHLTRLARSCFFEEQCHPLLLKLKGKELRERGRARFSSQEWKCLIDGLQVADDDVDYVDSEDQVVQVLLKSFDTLPRRLQNIFTDLLTCRKDEDMDVDVNCEWLAMLQSGGVGKAQVMKHQILTLEFHGLLEISTGLFSLIRIHDLYKRVAMCKSANQQEYFLNEQEYASGHNILFTTYKYMHLVSCKMGISIIKQLFHIINTKYGLPNLQVLWILGGGVHGIRSNMAALRLRNINMEVLRILRLEALLELEEVKGWEGVPNLESLHLEELDSLRSIGHLGILRKLESLVLRGCSRLQVRALVGTQLKLVKVGDGLPNLQVLEFSGNLQLVEVGPLPHDAFPALQSLDLHGCSFLKSFPDLKLDCLSSLNLKGCCRMKRLEGSICSLTALEELRLDSCSKIESIPDLSNVRRLRRLSASDCTSLKRLEGSFCSLKALEELNLRGCQELQSIPDLSNLLRLRTLDACNCVSLREGIIPGLGVLPALQDLFLSAISSGLVGGDSELCQLPAMLQRLVLTTGARRLDSLSRLTSLQKLRLMDCSSLTDVPTLAALTSLQCLWLSGCPNLSHLPDLKHITGLKFVKITGAPLLSEEYVRQRLNLSETRLYLSQTQRQFYSWITESLAFVDLERGENEALRRPLSIFSWELGKREST
ncbi:hypothetical protein L7F22_011268 [Adiantum nelumboides]|nr:hypothetical protein [Adiantum nelumboides]